MDRLRTPEDLWAQDEVSDPAFRALRREKMGAVEGVPVPVLRRVAPDESLNKKASPYKVSTSLLVLVWIFSPRLAHWLTQWDYRGK